MPQRRTWRRRGCRCRQCRPRTAAIGECQTGLMAERTHSESVVVDRPPEDVYDLVSDVTRTGEWSPVCTSCWWDDGDGPRVGAHFTGHNEVPGRTWETHCEVVAAEPGVEFAWMVGASLVRWGFTL